MCVPCGRVAVAPFLLLALLTVVFTATTSVEASPQKPALRRKRNLITVASVNNDPDEMAETIAAADPFPTSKDKKDSLHHSDDTDSWGGRHRQIPHPQQNQSTIKKNSQKPPQKQKQSDDFDLLALEDEELRSLLMVRGLFADNSYGSMSMDNSDFMMMSMSMSYFTNMDMSYPSSPSMPNMPSNNTPSSPTGPSSSGNNNGSTPNAPSPTTTSNTASTNAPVVAPTMDSSTSIPVDGSGSVTKAPVEAPVTEATTEAPTVTTPDAVTTREPTSMPTVETTTASPASPPPSTEAPVVEIIIMTETPTAVEVAITSPPSTEAPVPEIITTETPTQVVVTESPTAVVTTVAPTVAATLAATDPPTTVGVTTTAPAVTGSTGGENTGGGGTTESPNGGGGVETTVTTAPSSAAVDVGGTTPTNPDNNTNNGCSALDRTDAIFFVLFDLTDPNLLDNPLTPFGQAFRWIWLTDPLQLDPCSGEAFRQRYALAVLYYATDGPNAWTERDGWLAQMDGEDDTTMHHECSWFGVQCNEDNVVTELILGTFRGLLMLLLHLLVGFKLSRPSTHTYTLFD